jgi:hypothetical protein
MLPSAVHEFNSLLSSLFFFFILLLWSSSSLCLPNLLAVNNNNTTNVINNKSLPGWHEIKCADLMPYYLGFSYCVGVATCLAVLFAGKMIPAQVKGLSDG